MDVLEQGHRYALHPLDGSEAQILQFVKRSGPNYPYNEGTYSGTTCQEVIKALISRTKYLDAQIPCLENDIILNSLRSALIAFETRAARNHGIALPAFRGQIEDAPTSDKDGHFCHYEKQHHKDRSS